MKDTKRRILIIAPSWVGDIVMAQSLLKVIQKYSVSNPITVLAPKWSNPLLKRMPEVDDIVNIQINHGSLKLINRFQLASKLKKQKFYQAIVLPGSFKSALIPWFARIPIRTGFLGEQRYGLLNDIRKVDRLKMPRNVQRYASLGLPIGSTEYLNPPWPKLSLNQSIIVRSLTRFHLNIDKPILALCPGSEYGPAKQWPVKYFAEIANIQYQEGWQVWLFGSKKDIKTSEKIIRLSHTKCVNLTGKTNIGEAADLISLSTYVITNDSGLMHVASAMNCHVIAIYGSSSDLFTPPLTTQSHKISLNFKCRPCFKRTCPLHHTNCLNQIVPSKVVSILKLE